MERFIDLHRAGTRTGRRPGHKPETKHNAYYLEVAIAGHRKDAHGGHYQAGCAACLELERKHLAAIAQEGGRA